MATNLYLRNLQNAKPNVDLGVIGVDDVYDMVASAGSAFANAIVDSAASGTEILFTKTAGGSTIAFVSGRVPAGGFTLTSTFLSAWLRESHMNANAGGRYRIFKYSSSGPTLTEVGGGPFDDGVEFGTSSAEMTWTGNVTDTAFSEDDRLVLKLYITNIGTMGSGHTCTVEFDASAGAIGDSFFQIAETITFKAETTSQTLTPSLFTDGDTFYTATVTPGAVSLTPSLFTDGDTFYSPTVAQVTSLTQASRFDNSNTFYSPTVAVGPVTLTPNLYTDSDTFYSPTVSPGAVGLTPGLFTNSNTFYSPTISVGGGTQELTPSLFTDGDTFYSPTVTVGVATIAPGLFTNSPTFYEAVITGGAVSATSRSLALLGVG